VLTECAVEEGIMAMAVPLRDEEALSSPRQERTSDLYGIACENVFHPVWERFIKRRPTIAYLEEIERTQWLPGEEIERLQIRSLQKLLRHAEAVPYYRELFARIGLDPRDVRCREDLSFIPLLTKDIIRERYDDLVDPAHRGFNVTKGTSGSTGVPLRFEHCADSNAWREATKIRGYRWAGYRLGSPTLHYWAQVRTTPKGARGVKLRLDRGLKRETMIDSMQSDERSMLAAVEVLRRSKPTTIVAYTQSCAMWARFILDRGLRDWEDIPVICGAEAVLPQDRAVLARAFGSGIFETYGSRETMLMGSECAAHDGMHLAEENVLVEVGGKGDRAGDVVVTDLHNYGMPFIRYANGDVATMHEEEESCACGRGLRRLRRVDGRRADTLVDKDGSVIPGIVFHVLLSDARTDLVAQFQAVQHADRSITFRVVRGRDWNPERFGAIVARLEGYLRGSPLAIEFVDRILPMANGKTRTIVVEKPGLAPVPGTR
jgi:phenylacetate-CoA ligase